MKLHEKCLLNELYITERLKPLGEDESSGNSSKSKSISMASEKSSKSKIICDQCGNSLTRNSMNRHKRDTCKGWKSVHVEELKSDV